MRTLFALGALLAALLLASAPVRANDITVCNNDDTPFQYIALYNLGIPIFAEFWEMSGWYELEPGECDKVVTRPAAQSLYLSVRKLYEHIGPRIMHFEGPVVAQGAYVGEGIHTVEHFFCVTDAAFTRRLDTIDAFYECPAGYYKMLFNILIFSPDGTTFTADLG